MNSGVEDAPGGGARSVRGGAEGEGLRPAGGGPSGWVKVAVGLLLLKLVYLGGIGVAVQCRPDFDSERAKRILATWFPSGWVPEARSGVVRHLATWDAEHYLYLSREGYRPEARSVAFYPLWPLTLGVARELTGGRTEWLGLALANLFSLAGWVLFYRLAARRFGEAPAGMALALLVAFPGALFFQFLYSEALFFLLLMGLWWGVENRRYGAAMACAGLLPLCRGAGVFVVLPLAWHVWATSSRGWFTRVGPRKLPGLAGRVCPPGEGDGSHPDDGDETARGRVGSRGLRDGAPWALLGMPVAGWGLYLGLMWHWTGNPFAGLEAQRYWGVHAIANLWDVPKFVAGFFAVTTWHGYRGSALDRLGFLLAFYAALILWRRGRDLLPWWLALGLLPAMSGTFTSYLRFESCAFPVFLAWGVFLWEVRWRAVWWGLLGASAGMQVVLLWRFVNYRWAG